MYYFEVDGGPKHDEMVGGVFQGGMGGLCRLKLCIQAGHGVMSKWNGGDVDRNAPFHNETGRSGAVGTKLAIAMWKAMAVATLGPNVPKWGQWGHVWLKWGVS